MCGKSDGVSAPVDPSITSTYPLITSLKELLVSSTRNDDDDGVGDSVSASRGRGRRYYLYIGRQSPLEQIVDECVQYSCIALR